MSKLLDAVQKLNSGMSVKELKREYEAEARENSKQEGKCFGECESCGQKTCLEAETQLCGPCCFGEADTLNGNW